jgi:hypothetical protein
MIVTQPERGELDNQRAARLVTRARMARGFLQVANGVVVLHTAREQHAEPQVHRREIGVATAARDHALEQASRFAVAARVFEHSGRIHIVVALQIQLDGAFAVAEPFGEHAGLGEPAPPGKHLHGRPHALLAGILELLRELADEGLGACFYGVAQGAANVAGLAGTVRGGRKVPDPLE